MPDDLPRQSPPLLRALLPSSVATVEAYGPPAPAALFPQEAVWVAKAVPKRVDEFAAARACARAALRQFGVEPGPIPRGERGEPCWPDEFVGAITHCDGYRAAAVARRSEVVSVGIDAEPHGPLPDGVLGLVSSAGERDHLSAMAAAQPAPAWDRLLFSAKESVYKAWFPVARRWLGFEEAEVVFTPSADPLAGAFTARLSPPARFEGVDLGRLSGRYAVGSGLVVTAIVVIC
ncbi:4'-phosphopantetheinyl transferase family protein [Pilimelia columellifera]|uniref:4'-phosphopantetheinyl transferase n=1 Tax=Pilimelia columellifera subsp. columellifera TaxID=706583 RepID=A0ABP6AAN2_9ACTN